MAYWQHRHLHNAAWDYLLGEIQADVYLFQEGKPPASIDDRKRHLVWSEIGERRDWGSGIYSAEHDLSEEVVATQLKGIFSVANADIGGEKMTLSPLPTPFGRRDRLWQRPEGPTVQARGTAF